MRLPMGIGRWFLVALVGLLLTGCTAKPLDLTIEPRPRRDGIFLLDEAGGFESLHFGLRITGPVEPVTRVELRYRTDERPVRSTTLEADALALHVERGEGYLLRDIDSRFPRGLGLTAVDVRVTTRRGQSAFVRIPIRTYDQRRSYRLPLTGCWFVSSGHDLGVEHRRWYSKSHFAWDFIRLDADTGLPFRTDGRTAEDFLAFGASIVAPADGRVVIATDEHPDNSPGETSSRANQLLLDHGDGEFSKFAHLMKGSLLVVGGDRVRQGQPLARVGNSGRSDAPHLHFHFQETTFDETGIVVDERPLPIRLTLQRTSNEGVRRGTTVRPRRGDIVCAP